MVCELRERNWEQGKDEEENEGREGSRTNQRALISLNESRSIDLVGALLQTKGRAEEGTGSGGGGGGGAEHGDGGEDGGLEGRSGKG